MSHLNHLIRYEFRRFKGFSRMALIFIVLLPTLYGVIYLGANWDLYGKIDEIKIAVVNKDEGAEFNGETIAGGDQFVEALKDRPVVDWQFPASEQEALDGLHRGDYYMTLVIPENFSHNLVSAGDYNPQRAVLRIHRDDANGFIVGSLSRQIEAELAKTLDSTVSDAYFRAVFASLDEIRDGMLSAAEGAGQLDDGLRQAKDGVALMHSELLAASDELQKMNELTETIQASSTGVSAGLDEISRGTTGMRSSMNDLARTGTSAVGYVREAEAQLAPMFDHAAKQLPQLQKDAANLVNIHAQLSNPKDGLMITSERNVDRSLQRARGLLREHPELAKDANLTELIRSLEAVKTSQTTVSTKLNLAADVTGGIKLNLDTGPLETSTAQAKASLAKARKAAQGIDSVAQEIGASADKVANGMNRAREAATGFADAGSAIAKSVPKAVEGVVKLTDGVGQLNTAMPQLSDGAHQLATGLNDGVKRLPNLSDSEQESLAVTMSQPVDLQTTVDNDAEFYGRGLAPMFASLGIWILTVSAFLVIRTVSGRALVGRGGAWRAILAGFGPLACIAVISSWLMGFALWFGLGLNPVQPWLFFLLLTVAALSFFSLAYLVRIAIGSPQTAVFLVWLILQLPACGGTFPVEMLPSFFRFLAPLSPMWYSVTAMRVTISGGDLSRYWMCIAVLTIVGVVSTALIGVLVRRRQRFRMRDLHPPMITSTSTAEYAFSVRPR